MGKSKPSQKAKKTKSDAAFQKKKKKVGKKVLKSNETVISLKTRKIVIAGQHTQKPSDVMFKGKSLAGYLSGTKHTSASHRLQNVTTLQEMLTSCPQLMERHAGPLTERLGVLLQDTDENVRSSVLFLGKFFLSGTRSTDLAPFLNVLCVQLSSGLLHIDKAVQRSCLSFLLQLLDNHLASVQPHLTPIMGALSTLLKTTKNKSTVLLLCQAVFRLLSAGTGSAPAAALPPVSRGSGVAVWRVCGKRSHITPTTTAIPRSELEPLLRAAVTHLETLWLEDAPSQVYSTAEPSSLRTATFVATFLRQLLSSSPPLLDRVHLAALTKYLSARFPFSCTLSKRDLQLLQTLNLQLASVLVLAGMTTKVESFVLASLRTTGGGLETETEMFQVLAKIEDLSERTTTTLTNMALSGTASDELLRFTAMHLMIKMSKQDRDNLIKVGLAPRISSLGSHLVAHFWNPESRRHLASSDHLHRIVKLCLDAEAPMSGEVTEKFLELLYTVPPEFLCGRKLALLGLTLETPSLRRKFFSILQAMFLRGVVLEEDYLSVLLTQANRDDEDEGSSQGKETAALAEEQAALIVDSLALLGRRTGREDLREVYLPLIVQRLYTGLSTFSLLSHLHLLLFLLSGHSSEEGESDVSVVKLAKILSSLVFNRDSLEEWGKEVMGAAARVILASPTLTDLIIAGLRTKPPGMVFWFLKVLIARGERDGVARDAVAGLEGVLGASRTAELLLRLDHK